MKQHSSDHRTVGPNGEKQIGCYYSDKKLDMSNKPPDLDPYVYEFVEQFRPLLATKGEEIIPKIDAIYHFEFLDSNRNYTETETPFFITLDLKTPGGALLYEKRGEADATLIYVDDVLARLFGKCEPDKEISAIGAYWHGLIKFRGSYWKAYKLATVVYPLLNPEEVKKAEEKFDKQEKDKAAKK